MTEGAPDVPDSRVFDVSELAARRQAGEASYLEFLRVPALSAGLYELAAGTRDPQNPHREDEMYYVVAGAARFVTPGFAQEIGPGSIIFVKAGVEHRFAEITQDLSVLVFFAASSNG